MGVSCQDEDFAGIVQVVPVARLAESRKRLGLGAETGTIFHCRL